MIIKTFGEGFRGMVEADANPVKGIWNGISDMVGWILGKIRGFGDSVLSGIKSFFGIGSPSKLFRDQLGKNLALGIGEGFFKRDEKCIIIYARSIADQF